EQRITQRAEVYRHKHFIVSQRLPVNLTRDNFFTSTVFTEDQHSRICGGNLRDRLFDFANRFRFTAKRFVLFIEGGKDPFTLIAELPNFSLFLINQCGGSYGCQELFILPGLNNEIQRTFFECIYRDLNVCVCSHQHHLHVRGIIQYFTQPEQPFGSGCLTGSKVHVQQQYINRLAPEHRGNTFRGPTRNNFLEMRVKQKLDRKRYQFV